jgi:hypothetical protein
VSLVQHRELDLRALLEVTRPITPEEMAELQLEQGYVDRALSIYDELTEREPGNASYATKRAWLERMARRDPSDPRPAPEQTCKGMGPASPGVVQRRRIVGVR